MLYFSCRVYIHIHLKTGVAQFTLQPPVSVLKDRQQSSRAVFVFL